MIARFSLGHGQVSVDLSSPRPIHIPLRHGKGNPNAWYAKPPEFRPFRMGEFVGSVAEGGTVNTMDITFNPHGNGTHTESIGHIQEAPLSIDGCLEQHHFWTQVISLEPMPWSGARSEFRAAGDTILMAEQLSSLYWHDEVKALVLRTLPNDESKLRRCHTGSNPPYVDPAFMDVLVKRGIEHFLLDLPSVDRESDGGKMRAHRAFWQAESAEPRAQCSITEMVFVEDAIQDGMYLLNLLPAPFDNDASPSRPVLYSLIDGY